MKPISGSRFRRLLLWVCILLFTGLAEAGDLISVYRQAVQEDPQLERAREALGAIQETQVQASAALFLPEAMATANVNRDAQSVRLGGTSALGDSGRSNFMYGGYTLTLTQPILHVDRFIAWQQADSRIAQAEAEFAVAEIALLLRVTERYFEVLAAANNVQFANAQQDTLARGLKETRQRQAVGYLAMTDVQEAQAGFDRAVADAVEAEHQLRDAKEGLQEVTGNHYDQLASLRDDIQLIPPDPVDEQRWVNQALTQNLGLLVIEQTVKIAKASIDIQQAGHLPTLDATGSRSFTTSGGRFGTADIEDTVVGLALNVPLYQGGRVNSKIREAEHRYREAQAKLKQEQRTVHRAASKAYLGVVAGVSRVKALQQTVNSSQTGLAATQAGFRAGRRTALDVIVAERELLRAQKDYARARYDYVLDTLRLKQSVGTLSPEDLQQVNSWLTAVETKSGKDL
ncbi:MAG: TolC family outer membrane protein [Methylobacter sp.]|nr:TolC family outer membrane protein [Methylobacter sp.]